MTPAAKPDYAAKLCAELRDCGDTLSPEDRVRHQAAYLIEQYERQRDEWKLKYEQEHRALLERLNTTGANELEKTAKIARYERQREELRQDLDSWAMASAIGGDEGTRREGVRAVVDSQRAIYAKFDTPAKGER